MRGVAWNDSATEVAATVERGSVPRFIVYGVDGKPAGAFDTLGIVDVAPGQSVASGTYVGASPCTYGVTAKPNAGRRRKALDTPTTARAASTGSTGSRKRECGKASPPIHST